MKLATTTGEIAVNSVVVELKLKVIKSAFTDRPVVSLLEVEVSVNYTALGLCTADTHNSVVEEGECFKFTLADNLSLNVDRAVFGIGINLNVFDI